LRFYKNVGIIGSATILVFYSLYDELNLINNSKDLKQHLLTNITNINKNINVGKVLDENKNRIINYNEKIKIESEFMLIINADFKTMKEDYNCLRKIK
jgi:hypothetical protein